MARTTPILVKGILMRDYDNRRSPDLAPFIDTAGVVVDALAAAAEGTDTVPSATLLELLERWLAAHCYCLSDQPYESTKTEGAGAVFQGKTDMYLAATKYGQMAVTLDPTGFLAGVAAPRRRASASWLGKRPSEQVPYDQRD